MSQPWSVPAVSSISRNTSDNSHLLLALRLFADQSSTIRITNPTTLTVGVDVYHNFSVAEVPTANDFADMFVRMVSQNPPRSTEYYALTGAVDDELIHAILTRMIDPQLSLRKGFHCHLFLSSDESGGPLACETISEQDLNATSCEIPDLNSIRGIALVSLSHSNGRRVVVTLSSRITVAVIALLHLPRRSFHSVLCIDDATTAEDIKLLIREYTAIEELCAADGNNEDDDVRTNKTGTPVPSSSPAMEDEERELMSEHIDTLERMNEQLKLELGRTRSDYSSVSTALEEHKARQAHVTQLVQQYEEEKAALIHHVQQLETEVSTMMKQRETQRLIHEQTTNHLEQLQQSNHALERRILEHQQERNAIEAERVAFAQEREHLMKVIAEGEGALARERKQFQEQDQSNRREQLRTVMEFQQREKIWQRELASTSHLLESTSQQVQMQQQTLDEQARQLQSVEYLASHSQYEQARELEELVRQVKILSPLQHLKQSEMHQHHLNQSGVMQATSSQSPSSSYLVTSSSASRSKHHRTPPRYPSEFASSSKSRLPFASGGGGIVSPLPGERSVEIGS